MHPFAFTSSRDNAGAAKVRQVTRNFRLALPQNFNEIADANLTSIHEIQEAQARAVRKGCEKQRQVVALRGTFHKFYYIWIDRYVQERIYSL